MYSCIKSSRNGYHSIAYPMTEKKNQKTERIGAFRCGGGIIDTGTIKGIREQFAKVWKREKERLEISRRIIFFILSVPMSWIQMQKNLWNLLRILLHR